MASTSVGEIRFFPSTESISLTFNTYIVEKNLLSMFYNLYHYTQDGNVSLMDACVLRNKEISFNLQIYALQRDERATQRIFKGIKAHNEIVRFSVMKNMCRIFSSAKTILYLHRAQ